MSVLARLRRPDIAAATASVAILVIINATGLLLAPAHLRILLSVVAIVAVAAGAQSAASEPADLGPALLFTLPALIAVIGNGAWIWLIAPLGALLLAAGELNALAWECRGVGPTGPRLRARFMDIAVMTGLTAVAGGVILLAARVAPPVPGRWSVAVAAVAIAVLGHALFRRRGAPG